MKQHLRIRRAEEGDVELLARLNLQLVEDEQHRNRMSLTDLTARMRQWLSSDYVAHLFYQDDKVAGYALTRQEDEYLYLRQFFVVANFRRQKIGTQAFEQLARSVWSGLGRLRLDVLTHNQRGIAFWRSLGFRDYMLTLERSVDG